MWLSFYNPVIWHDFLSHWKLQKIKSWDKIQSLMEELVLQRVDCKNDFQNLFSVMNCGWDSKSLLHFQKVYIAYSWISSQLWFFYLLMEMFAHFPTRSCNWFIIFMIIHCNMSVYTFYGNKRYILLERQNFTFFNWKSITYNQPHTFWVFFYIILAYQVKQIALWRNVATSSKSTKCELLATKHHIFWKKIFIGNIQCISRVLDFHHPNLTSHWHLFYWKHHFCKNLSTSFFSDWHHYWME